MSEIVTITPELKVGELLEAYPDLESRLIEMSSAFAKLKNPVLRKTIARVTTLRQAARVGDVPLERMINELRSAAGQQPVDLSETADRRDPAPPPPWFDPEAIEQTLDVRPILARGEKPVARVMRNLRELSESSIYRVVCDFYPAPLVEMAEEEGFESWTRRRDETIEVFFSRSSSSELVELD